MNSSVSRIILATILAGCTAASAQQGQVVSTSALQAAGSATPTAADAEAFLARAEKELGEYSVTNARAQWVNNTYVNDDTDALATYFGTIGTEMAVRFASEAAKYQKVQGLSADARRKLDLLRGGLVLPAPQTPGAAAELNEISTRLNSAYAKGRGTLDGKEMTGNDLEEKMGTVRNPAQLQEMWTSWHTNVGGPMRKDYARLVTIANQGAKDLGYADTGAMWRSNYDMTPQEFTQLVEKLWGQVKPLYDELHCYTRAKLNARYGDAIQKRTGPIRADLLGNMWAQEWGNIYDIVAPKGVGDIGFDLTDLLVANKYDAVQMVKAGERFYTSLGLILSRKAFGIAQ